MFRFIFGSKQYCNCANLTSLQNSVACSGVEVRGVPFGHKFDARNSSGASSGSSRGSKRFKSSASITCKSLILGMIWR